MSSIFEKEQEVLDTIRDQYLTFVVDEEDYGISIAYVKEIISISAITKVPHTPDYVKGIINLRGDIIAVIDIRKRFFKEEREYDALTCVIVVEYGSYSVGIIVDRVREVVFIRKNNIAPPPDAKLNFENQFVENIGTINGEVKLILTLDKLLSAEEY